MNLPFFGVEAYVPGGGPESGRKKSQKVPSGRYRYQNLPSQIMFELVQTWVRNSYWPEMQFAREGGSVREPWDDSRESGDSRESARIDSRESGHQRLGSHEWCFPDFPPPIWNSGADWRGAAHIKRLHMTSPLHLATKKLRNDHPRGNTYKWKSVNFYCLFRSRNRKTTMKVQIVL